MHHDQAIPTSESYGATDDVAPAGRENGDEPVFTGFRGKYGMLKTNIVTSYAMVGALLGGPTSPDGMLFIGYAEPIADAWIAWGKTNPQYMRIVTILWGGPFMTLIIAHGPLVAGVMANHQIKLPFARLLNPVNMGAMNRFREGLVRNEHQNPVAASGQADTSAADTLGSYRPAGPFAPTDDPGPPPAYVGEDVPLRVYPEEGIPSDIDVQLREAARAMNIPYAELRDQYLLQTAQDRIAQNMKVAQPGTLGMPVTRQ